MRVIIVEDEKANVKNLTTLLNRYCLDVNIVGSAGNIDSALEIISLHQPDLIFLDIQLGFESAFDLLRMIPQRNFEVIFVTAFDHYGIQAIKFAALDYVLKPIDIEDLKYAVSKASTKIGEKRQNQQLDFLISNLKKDNNQQLRIALPQHKEIRYVLVSEIVRCEADNSYTLFVLENGEKILVSKVLKEYAELLQSNNFIRTHRSHIVNLAFVKSWLNEDGGVLLLVNGDKVPVSKPNKVQVLRLLGDTSF